MTADGDGTAHARRPRTPRLLTVSAVLLGLFFMHGAPASASEGCHGVPMTMDMGTDMDSARMFAAVPADATIAATTHSIPHVRPHAPAPPRRQERLRRHLLGHARTRAGTAHRLDAGRVRRTAVGRRGFGRLRHRAVSPTASMPSEPSTPSTPSMNGMDAPAAANGLSAGRDGYRLVSPDARLPTGAPATYRFSVTAPDGRPLTAFALDQTQRMRFYAVRSDLTGFQHVRPGMAKDGTWTARLAALAGGAWRFFASFTPDAGPGKGTDVVLSRTVTAPGAASSPVPLPAPKTSAKVDGYTVTVKGAAMAGMAGMAHPPAVTATRNGRPVTDLQPYLGTYAHLAAFHTGDLAFAHLHPTTAVNGDHGGPNWPSAPSLRRQATGGCSSSARKAPCTRPR
ncbi:hypothetical protein [Streptomyces sp. NPDC008139]|uniref:hypothetical protein n=1 Tax=Streptomyces sp. NPDC008139 TaxID=3364814 RepID=UPI0036EFB787